MEKTIKEAIFYVKNSILDEKSSCVRIPTGGDKLGLDDIFLIGRSVESKYSSLKFSMRYEIMGNSLVFYYNK